MKTIGHWIQGLACAAISAAAGSISVIAIDPMEFNFSEGLGNLGKVAMVSAIIAIANFLKQSPLPGVQP